MHRHNAFARSSSSCLPREAITTIWRVDCGTVNFHAAKMIARLVADYFPTFDPFVVMAVVTVMIALCYYYSTSTYGVWRALNVPYVRPVPLFGNTFRMILSLENQSVTFDRIYRQFSDRRYCGLYQMRTPFLMIRDPALITAITVRDFGHFTDHGIQMDTAVNMLARSLVFTNGQRWRTMRQKLSPGFSSGKLKETYGQIQECGAQLTTRIAEKSGSGPIEVKETIGTFATDVIGTCAFGLKLDTITNDDSEFRMYTKKIFGNGGFVQMLKMFVGMLLPDVAKALRVKVFPTDATEFFYSVFRDVLDHRTKNNVIRNDLAQTLIQARRDLVPDNPIGDSADEFCDLDIIANAILLFSAGAEPIAITTSLCLYELALNKNIQDRLRGDIITAQEKSGGKVTSDFLSEIHYADMILNEVLRKYSITVSLMREATQDYQIPDDSLFIKKGQKLIIPMYSIHNDPKYYPDPETFDPERFSAEEKLKRPNGTFLPFGEGPRICIAKRFAEMEIKLVLSQILAKFEIQPCEKTDIPLEMKIGPGVMAPKNGIWLTFKPLTE